MRIFIKRLKVLKKAIRLASLTLLMILSLTTISSYGAQIKVVTEYFPPYQILNSDGSLGGFSTEVVLELFKLTGDTPDIHTMPWARAYDTVKKSKNVMVFTIAHTDIRHGLFQWVGRLSGEYLYIWGLKSRFNQPFESLEQMHPYSIATSRHSNPDQYFTAHQFEHLYRLVKPDQNLGMLLTRRIDLIISSEQSLKIRLNKMKIDLSMLTKVFKIEALNNNLSIAFNLNSDHQLVSRYQQAFEVLEKRGTINVLKRKWSIRD
ncbi:MAG: polar amino acid transport system substrate-binding protein [Alteromonadaceae bacterium]|jgi:polar amino acid transport system substrate-binding protein